MAENNNIGGRHEAFVTVYKPIAGWKAVLMTWNDTDEELGGFWEPWNTGMFAYATEAEAIEDAKQWAKAEEIEFKPNSGVI